MADDKSDASQGWTFTSFLSDILKSFIGDLLRLVIVFAIGTAAGAAACLYYGFPVGLSLLGGFVALGVALLILSNL